MSIDRSQRVDESGHRGVTDRADYVRGKITVLDRPQLEQLSCECYALVKRESDRILHASPLYRSAERER